MASAIEPEMCVTTGRLLTEWFEYPEYTDEQIEKEALEHFGLEEKPVTRPNDTTEKGDLMRRFNAFVAARKRRKWRNYMKKDEIAYRMNEATKMVDPTNFKFLPDDVRERTGLEINPLWMMECLVRSGILSPKEQIQALKELAQYTHSKAPSINHNTTTHLKPEDWLLELAKEEYKVLGEDIPMRQPMQPVERGSHKWHESKLKKRVEEFDALADYSSEQLKELEAIVDAEWEEKESDG